jgi:glycosyltransferase involved in cell wall biosynthesis
MKVLHLYNLHRFRGGADNATLATVELLRAGGIEVCAMSYDSRDLASGMRGRLEAFAAGIYGSAALRNLNSLLDSFRPDVVHAHKLYPLISPWALRLAHRRGIPVVMSTYDYVMTCPVATHSWNGAACTRCVDGSPLWGVLRNCRGRLTESVAYVARHAVARRFRLYEDHVSRFVTPNRFTATWLTARAAIPAERIVVIPFPFELPESPADPARGSYIAYVGRFAPEKGVAALVEAARCSGLPFRFAGDSAALPMAEHLPNVQLVVTRTPAQLAEFYRNARALVVPSLWFETLPLVVGEAMSHGIPVIASRVGGLPEFVNDGVTGLLVEPGDAADLARKATRLWEAPRLAQRLGAAARAYVQEKCSAAVVFERLRAVYAAVSGHSDAVGDAQAKAADKPMQPGDRPTAVRGVRGG